MSARDQITGRTLGDFVVREKLGEGGFGAVYRAEQPLLQREAVIKVLHRRLRASEVVIQRFLREARLASHLDHPYAAHVYAFGAEDDGLLWIAMELVRGTPLDKLLRTQGTIPLERLVQLFDRICEVVHTAHEQGIVHRDIKPANVIVMSRAGRILPKLLDFGIAKVADPEPLDGASAEATWRSSTPDLTGSSGNWRLATGPALRDSAPRISLTPEPTDLAYDQTRAPDDHAATLSESPIAAEGEPSLTGLTQRGSLVGSPRYMAPEQWIDPSAADARADIYALGVLAYEALTGKPPFDGHTLYEVATAHAEGQVPPVGDQFPAALDAVFARALAKTPDERYRSALELAVAFRDASGLGAEARETLPQLDETLRDALIADAPQPIAEAVAALAAATNAHQAREAVRIIVHVAVRLIGLVSLACRTRLGADDERDSDAVVEALRSLRRRTLADDEWLDLARELCRPYAAKPDVFPVPELVTMFFDRDGLGTSRASPLDETLAMPAQTQRSGMSEDQVRELLASSLPGLTRFLHSIAFLADYPLVVWRGDRAERWMGVRRPKRSAMVVRGRRLELGQPALVDREGQPVLALWPLVQACEPSPGAPEELFLFEGKGRHGARFVALPQDFERQDDSLWAWFGTSLLDTLDEAGPSVPGDAPYRGLAPFTASDAALFFGREREVEAFVNRLRAQPLIAVVGPSGAGKSSFVQAGVIPSLPEDWRVLIVRPGPSPVAALEARLAQDGIELSLATSEPDALGDALRASAKATATTIVIVVDQLEELFTLCQDVEQRTRYGEALVRAARAAEDRVRVIVTLRDDFLLVAEQLVPFRARLAQGLQLLSTPARQDLLRIVTEPARRAGYDFEDRDLPAQMVDAVVDQPGALALLSFSAARLWELRDRHFKQLGRRAYEAMGGVGGALAQHAETTLASLSADEQRVVREAFRHLVTAEGTRAVLTRSELRQILGGGTRADGVIERLIAARLLVASEGEAGEERVEVIHEALLGAWPRLVGWRREDADGARLRHELRAAARQWQERRRPRGLLWRDESLTEYRLWRARHPGALTESEAAFANASLGEARRSRRVRRLLLTIAFVALTIGLAVLYRTNQETGRQRQVAEAQGELARVNADKAKQRLVELYQEQGRLATLANDPMRALVFLEQAYREGADNPALHFMIGWATQRLEGQLAWFKEPSQVRSVALSRDGRLAVTGGKGPVSVWDVASQRRLHALGGHVKTVQWVRFTTDTRQLISMSVDAVKVWEVGTGALLHSRELGVDITAIAHTDHAILTGGSDGTAKVWDAASGEARFALVGHTSKIWVAAVDHRGQRFATGDQLGTVRLWQVADGRLLGTIAAHQGRLAAITFSPDDGQLATSGFEDGHARVWDVATRTRVAEVKHRAPQVRSVAFDPTGERLVTGAEDRMVRISSARTGAELQIMESASPPVDTRFDHDGKRVLSTHWDGSVRLWDASTGAAIWSFLGHDETVWGAMFDDSGTRFMTGSVDGSAAVWDANHSGHLSLPGHVGDVWSSAFSRDGKLAVTTAEDGQARIWKLPGGELVRSIAVEMPEYGGAAFSPDGEQIAIVGAASAGVFDIASGRLVFSLVGETKATNVAYDAAGAHLATVTETGSVRLWDAASGAMIRTFAGHDAVVWSVAFAPDGKRLATASDDGKLKIWDVASGTLLGAFEHTKTVAAVAFSADGNRVVTGSEDRLVRIWDVASGKLVAQLDGHSSVVSTVELSPDGQFVLTAGHDGTVRIWDTLSGRQLVMVGALTDGYFSSHYAPDGRSVIVTSRGATSVWTIPRVQLSERAVQRMVACKVPSRLHARDASYVPCSP